MSRPDISIGLSISLSGKFHLQGEHAIQGLLLWRSYINAQGGITVQNGEKRPVRLICMTIAARSVGHERTSSGLFNKTARTFS